MGRRRYMEDKHVVVQEEEEDESDGAIVTAVFDGHGGPEVSEYLQSELYNILLGVAEAPSLSHLRDKSVEECVEILRATLNHLDACVLDRGGWNQQGSTVLVAWLHRHQRNKSTVDDVSQDGATLIVANIGDSRAVLGRIVLVPTQEDGETKNEVILDAIQLSRDHKPDDPDEKERIESLGGNVTYSMNGVPRVNGVLSLSRAIGDGEDRPFVSAQPDITTISVGGGYVEDRKNDKDSTKAIVLQEFVILATDGLWDVMTSEYAVKLIAAHEQGGMNRRSIPKELVKLALTLGSCDNITVVILWLGPLIQPDSLN